ncbi:hypothetical protein DOJK_00511 [Patescibacteria group bacterium]|nr:hypothetical protein DOJK_00511 [Patescibacteria group bacterium]
MKFFGCIFICGLLSACTAEQMYSSGQNWQRNQCHQLADRDVRARCATQADMSYDAYQQNRQP